ncbi:hypothetical protein LTR35_003054 [Friedmanniomyces endolithicus]|nr:hypothetical protein LTR35_003054 [Friedmanniomyces endolithicus]KAK0300424.1 hypothetical protein LTS00_000679 [Friedmanniomyces endolithicus]KAK0998951.1 hypothetical protein LTR54_009391 [Friedmanniomyces endolithicus]
MANGKNKGQAQGNVAAPLEQALEKSRREHAASLAQQMLGTNPQKLAQEMLGKHRRPTAPRMAGPGPGPVAGTLASRVGVTKPSHLSKPPTTDNYRAQDRNRDRDRDRRDAPREPITISSDSGSNAKGNGYVEREMADTGAGLSIRGAASGPYIVEASNFAPGTTAADIESVMQGVGGQLNYCRLVEATPTVIAQMSFVDKLGAEAVIKMFNNKKADGRTLLVQMLHNNGNAGYANGGAVEASLTVEEEPLSAFVDTIGDDAMEVDEHADARAAEDRQREERRREPREPREQRQPREPREPAYPTGPAQGQANDYQRRAEPAYQDGRFGFDGRDRGYGGARGGSLGRGGGGGGRMYSDRMTRGGRGGSGQSYRP